MYNQILIVLIFLSLILLINYYSLYIDNNTNEKTEKVETLKKIESLEKPKIEKKVRFNLDPFQNNKEFDINIPQNSNDFIIYKDINNIDENDDMTMYNDLTIPKFINIDYDEIERISGKPYEYYKKDDSLEDNILYQSYDKETINNINFNHNSEIKPYSRLGVGSLL